MKENYGRRNKKLGVPEEISTIAGELYAGIHKAAADSKWRKSSYASFLSALKKLRLDRATGSERKANEESMCVEIHSALDYLPAADAAGRKTNAKGIVDAVKTAIDDLGLGNGKYRETVGRNPTIKERAKRFVELIKSNSRRLAAAVLAASFLVGGVAAADRADAMAWRGDAGRAQETTWTRGSGPRKSEIVMDALKASSDLELEASAGLMPEEEFPLLGETPEGLGTRGVRFAKDAYLVQKVARDELGRKIDEIIAPIEERADAALGKARATVVRRLTDAARELHEETADISAGTRFADADGRFTDTAFYRTASKFVEEGQEKLEEALPKDLGAAERRAALRTIIAAYEMGGLNKNEAGLLSEINYANVLKENSRGADPHATPGWDRALAAITENICAKDGGGKRLYEDNGVFASALFALAKEDPGFDPELNALRSLLASNSLISQCQRTILEEEEAPAVIEARKKIMSAAARLTDRMYDVVMRDYDSPTLRKALLETRLTAEGARRIMKDRKAIEAETARLNAEKRRIDEKLASLFMRDLDLRIDGIASAENSADRATSDYKAPYPYGAATSKLAASAMRDLDRYIDEIASAENSADRATSDYKALYDAASPEYGEPESYDALHDGLPPEQDYQEDGYDEPDYEEEDAFAR